MDVEAFGPEAAEGLNERVVGWLAGPREVDRNAALVGPQVKFTQTRRLDRGRIVARNPISSQGPFQHAEGEPLRQRCPASG